MTPPTSAWAHPAGTGGTGGWARDARWRRSTPSILTFSAIAFIAATATLVQAYVLVKAVLLALFLLVSVSATIVSRRVAVHPRLVAFYVGVAVLGAVWGVVGLLHPGNSVVGVTEALRLYCLWSVAFLIIFSLLRSRPSLLIFHSALVLAGILIAVVNMVALADQLLGWGLVSLAMREQLELFIGVHDGYVQITSNNIGALFPIVPYLISVTVWGRARDPHPRATTWALVLTLLVAALSGRRALWLVVAVTPCTLLALSYLTGCRAWLGRRVVRALWAYSLLAAVAITLMFAAPEALPESGYVAHVQEAFSSVDERTIQKPFLVEAFVDAPVLGSGFGASAGYLRNYERPWTGYELTYHQMLFNLGMVGFGLLAALFVAYLAMVCALLRRFGRDGAIPFALLLGCLSLLLGAYSNRYFGSFDYLFFVGLLPYLATFTRGFGEITSDRSAGG